MDKLFTLNNGTKIPRVGFGTWRLYGDEAKQGVLNALEAGYTHIDTAALYENEKEVGQAIKESGADREKLFITTKVWNDKHNYKDATKSFQESLKLLDVEYVNLLLIHWPVPVAGWQEKNQDMWKAFEDIYANGKAKAIGISNFHKVHIASLLEKAEIKPAVNQIKISPGVLQEQVSRDTKEFGIDIEAYSPLDKGIATSNAVLAKIALEYGKTPAQVALRWNLEKGNIVLPKASSLEHAKSNLELFDFSLSEKDMKLIDSIQSPDSKVPDPNSMLD